MGTGEKQDRELKKTGKFLEAKGKILKDLDTQLMRYIFDGVTAKDDKRLLKKYKELVVYLEKANARWAKK